MGQSQVKISIDNYLISMYQLKNNKILIQGDRVHFNKKISRQYRSIYKFKELSKQFKTQFLSIEDFIQKIQKNQGLCCGGRSGIYNYKIDGNILIIKKHNKQFIIQLTKVKKQSQQLSQNDQSQRVSLQQRLQRHISSKQHLHDQTSKIHIKKNKQNSKQQNQLQNFLHMTKQGLSLNLYKQNIGSFQLKYFQKLDVKFINQLDIIDNQLTQLDLEQIFQLQWHNLKKLHLDTNQIKTISGLYLTLKQLQFLSLSNNQIGIDSAQFLINNQWPLLQFLKIQFKQQQQLKCLQKLSQTQLRNFPQLKKLIIIHNRQLTQQTANNFRIWQNSQEGRQITYRYFQHPKLTSFVRKF